MSRLVGLLAAVRLSAQRASEAAAPPPSRPNILFLFADGQGADAIRAWGNAFTDLCDLFPTRSAWVPRRPRPASRGGPGGAVVGRRRYGLAAELVPAQPRSDARGAGRAVQADRLPPGDQRQLFELAGYPDELRNLAADPAARQTLTWLKALVAGGDGRCGAARSFRSAVAPARPHRPRGPARPLAATVDCGPVLRPPASPDP